MDEKKMTVGELMILLERADDLRLKLMDQMDLATEVDSVHPMISLDKKDELDIVNALNQLVIFIKQTEVQ